jgi:quercetin dioxygenase-like cupin family protein
MIRNPRTGQTMRFAPGAGDSLVIETVNPPAQVHEPQHVHPCQVSHVRMVSGCLRFTVDGAERDLGPGEELTIPAGVPHRFANHGDVDAVAVQEFRPALRTEEFFRTYFALAERGEIGDSGRPSLLRMAILGPRFAREIRVTTPPWPVQRITFAVLAPIARLRGYGRS